MALFQPFKKTPGRPTPQFMQTAIMQGQLDQQEQAQKNQARNAMYGGATDLGVGLYGEYKDDKSPIGRYLREMTGGDMMDDPARPPEQGAVEAQVPGQPSTDPTVGVANPMDPLPDAYMPSGEAAIDEAAVDQGGNMFADTYAPPADIGMDGATEMVGAEAGTEAGEAAADDSIRGVLESLFSGGGDAALEQGGEQVAEAATEKAAEKAGAGFTPGLGSVMSLAQGDVEGAAAKYALSMLPPPYNMLAMFV